MDDDEGVGVFDCPCGFDGDVSWRGSGPLIFWDCPLCGALRIRASWKRMTRMGIQMTNGSEHVPEFPGVVGEIWRELRALGRLFYSPQQEEEE